MRDNVTNYFILGWIFLKPESSIILAIFAKLLSLIAVLVASSHSHLSHRIEVLGTGYTVNIGITHTGNAGSTQGSGL